MLTPLPLLWLACADPPPAPAEPARLHLSPGEVDFGEVPLHEHRSATLTLTNTGEESLDLWEVRVVDDRARAYLSPGTPDRERLGPGESAAVELSFAALSVGPLEAELEVFSALGLTPPVPVRATVRGVPTLRVSPESLDFGEIGVGEIGVLDLRLANTGNDDLLLGDLEVANLSEGAFSVLIDPSGVLLQPGNDDGLLSIAFAPSAPGDYVEVFILNSNDPDAPQLAVSAAGTAR